MQEVVGSTPILSTPEFLKFVKFIKSVKSMDPTGALFTIAKLSVSLVRRTLVTLWTLDAKA